MPEERTTFEIYKENFSRLRFNHFSLSGDENGNFSFGEIPDLLIRAFEFEFYYRKSLGEKPSGKNRRRRFEKKFHRRQNQFPPLFPPESFSFENLSMLSTGAKLSDGGLIGYFIEVKNDGRYFKGFSGKEVRPLGAALHSFLTAYKTLILSMDEKSEIRKQNEPFFRDAVLIFEAMKFIAKLIHYSAKKKKPELHCGHLAGFFSGLFRFKNDLEKMLLKSGTSALTLPTGEPLSARLNDFKRLLNAACLDFAYGMILPLMKSESLMVHQENEGFLFESGEEEAPGGFAAILDKILALFRKKQKEEEKNESKSVDLDSPLQGTPEKKAPPSEPLSDAKQFQKLFNLLNDFLTLMKESLAPEMDEKGKIIDYHGMFDQFDLPPEKRDLTYTHFVLRGRIKGANPNDLRYQDSTIVRSVHFLHDRILKILTLFDFNEDQCKKSRAKEFLVEVRSLIYPAPKEHNEILLYGNFPQFRICLRRLFSSHEVYSRFNGMMNDIVTAYDRAKESL